MKVTVDKSGLDRLKTNMENLAKQQEVPLSQVFTPSFVSSHSRFSDFESLLAAAGITTAEEFKAFPDDEFDAFIAANTDFETWLDMQKKGGAEYFKTQLTKR